MADSPEAKSGSPESLSGHKDTNPVISDAEDTALPAEEASAEPATAEDTPAAEPAEEPEPAGLGDDISDDESVLSEVDEAQFEDFDPENIHVEEERPQLAADEENLKLVGRHKRKRSEDGGEGDRPRRKKEGRREKKTRRMKELEEGGERVQQQRRERKRREGTPEEEQMLDPATRRRRALDRIMDEALKKPTKRRPRKQDGIVCCVFWMFCYAMEANVL